MERWVGSLAVVTGASAGIGAAIAEKLVKAGVYVVGIGRRVELIEELSDKLSNENGKLHPVLCDLTDEQQILNTFKWIEETLGPVSILVNNAGVLYPTTLSDGEIEKWRNTFDVNVMAYCICTREAIKSMKAHRIDGIIINISSVTGLQVPEMCTSKLLINVYPATKHAVNALSSQLVMELRKENSKIRVSEISPGIVESDLYRVFPEDEAAVVADAYPMLKAEQVANAALYILSTPPNILTFMFHVSVIPKSVYKRRNLDTSAIKVETTVIFGDTFIEAMDRWVGTTAIVTGASSGIGAAIAKKFVEAGINVVGLARRLELLEELSQNVSTDTTKLYPIRCDAMDEKQILETYEWIESNIGPISILVNNAGIFNGSTQLIDGDIDIWKQTFYVNCIGLCIFTREAIKSMKNHEVDGLIINISSISARYVPDVPSEKYRVNVYPASKHAVKALTDSLRLELRAEKSKIRITSISPGITVTDIFRDHPAEDMQAFGSMPYMHPDDLANCAMYILGTPPDVQIQEVVIRPIGEYI